MKHAAAALVLVAGLTSLSPSWGQEKKPGNEAMDEMTKKWTEYSSPGEAHKRLNDLAGTWETESKIWMGGTGVQPTVTRGSSENKWILGGRFLQQEMKGEMMGMPMNGIGVMGYDNFKKKYVGFWIDNTYTGQFTMEGTVDQTGRVFTMYGTMDEWMTGEHNKMVKYVTKIVGTDKHIFEIHDLSLPEGSTKTVEMTYTRKK